MIGKCSRDRSRHSTAPSHVRKSKLALKVKIKALLPDDEPTKQPAEYSFYRKNFEHIFHYVSLQ